MTVYTHRFETPFGAMLAAVNAEGELTYLNFCEDTRDAVPTLSGVECIPDAARCMPVVTQLNEYFCGDRQEFDLPLAPAGTPFQKKVWQELQHIPYGATWSYGQLAAKLGNPNASRAVGRANATNPISVVVPCHRVIGTNGKLTGYGGGLPRKERLLRLEQEHLPANADRG
ncbi:MAG TPA: methylated-DNA--[protein]-cysteine S-methyltransferase [Chthonomonadaceae bacterium]|nr:methylated-DNA--[protein]-cysteine S-methyltransferase [Chthonomonadaceae bacterium]